MSAQATDSVRCGNRVSRRENLRRERSSSARSEIWESNPLLRKYLGTPHNPELLIYRIRPERVRLMHEWALEYAEVPLA